MGFQTHLRSSSISEETKPTGQKRILYTRTCARVQLILYNKVFRRYAVDI